jgi:hypothetical protein
MGTVMLGLLAFLLGNPGPKSVGVRWRNVRDGMSEREVKEMLGEPTWTGGTGTVGAGGRYVTEWQYKSGLYTYAVDFDYIGPGGAPLVFRTEQTKQEWVWAQWWPGHAKSRG